MAPRARSVRPASSPGRDVDPEPRTVGCDAPAGGFPLGSWRIEPPAPPDRRRRRDDGGRDRSGAELRAAVDGLLLLAAVLLLLAAVAAAVGLVLVTS